MFRTPRPGAPARPGEPAEAEALPPGRDASRETDLGLYTAVALDAASRVIGRYSTSFSWACRTLPAPQRRDIAAIYAMVRVADEIVDGTAAEAGVPGPRVAAALDAYEAACEDAMATGFATDLVLHAFADVARRHGITPELTRPFFASMRADLTVAEHGARSLEEYIHGSAEVVGLMCLRVFLGGDDAAYARLAPAASALGAAFQKVNFLRDLADDHEVLGRHYFPGLDPARFTDTHRDELLDGIDADLAVAAAAIPEIPASSRRAVRAAHGLFAALSRQLRQTPAAEIRRTRVRVPDRRKAVILLSALTAGSRGPVGSRGGSR